MEIHRLSNQGARIASAARRYSAIRQMRAYWLSNHDPGIALTTYSHGRVIRGIGTHPLSNQGAGIALETCDHGGAIRGMGTHMLSNHSVGIALALVIMAGCSKDGNSLSIHVAGIVLATCNHGEVIRGWELTPYPATVPGLP